MSAAQLIARLQAQRDSWLVLQPAEGGQPELAVCLRRPAEAELVALRPSAGQPAHALLTDAICRHAVDWRGFSEAALLGPALGSSDPLPFDAALWAEVVRDRGEWITACIEHLMAAVNRHRELREEQQKN